MAVSAAFNGEKKIIKQGGAPANKVGGRAFCSTPQPPGGPSSWRMGNSV